MKHPTLAVLLVAGLVRASSAEGDVGDPLTMNRLTPVSTFGVDVGVPVWDTSDAVFDTDFTAVGVTAGGHFVDKRSGFGGYLAIPLSFLSLHVDLPIVDDYDETEVALGNIEVGGMYGKWFGRVAVVANVGVTIPTANDPENDDDFVIAAQPLASAPRYRDLVQRIPESTWLRVGISPMGREGKLFWRADLGLDFAIDDDNMDSLSPIFNIAIGGGVDLGAAQVYAELVTLVTDSDGDDTNSVLGLGARFGQGNLRPGVVLLVPMGFEEGNGYDLDLGFGASLAARL